MVWPPAGSSIPETSAAMRRMYFAPLLPLSHPAQPGGVTRRTVQEARARATAEGRAAAAQEELEVEQGSAREARRAAAAARPQLQQLRTDVAAAKAAAATAEEGRMEAQAELDALAAALRQTRSTYLACSQVRPCIGLRNCCSCGAVWGADGLAEGPGHVDLYSLRVIRVTLYADASVCGLVGGPGCASVSVRRPMLTQASRDVHSRSWLPPSAGGIFTLPRLVHSITPV